MAVSAPNVVEWWECIKSPTCLSPAAAARRLFRRRRGLSPRLLRLVCTFALSPLLFSHTPPLDSEFLVLLGTTSFAAETPHAPAPLSGKQRHLVALVDKIAKAFDESFKMNEDDDDCLLEERDVIEFIERFSENEKFPNCCRPLTFRSLCSMLEQVVVSHSLWTKVLAQARSERWSSQWSVDESDLAVVVVLVLGVVARVIRDPEAASKTLDTLNTQFHAEARDWRLQGNRVFYNHTLPPPEVLRSPDGETDRRRVGFHRAADLYTSGLAVSPFDPRLYQNRAQCFFRLESYELALTDALRAYLLDPDFEAATYLLGECLYRIGEVEAAKAINRAFLSSRALRATRQTVNLLGIQPEDGCTVKQYDGWIKRERKAKNRLERELRSVTTAFLTAGDPLMAIEAYGRVDDVIEAFGCPSLGILDIDLAVISYCRALAYIESGIPYYVNCAVENMQEILDDSEIKFPLGFLALAKGFQRLRLYATAIDWANKGVDFIRRGFVATGGCHYWPGSQIIIEESRRDRLEESLQHLKRDCHRMLTGNPPPPEGQDDVSTNQVNDDHDDDDDDEDDHSNDLDSVQFSFFL